MPTPGSDKEVTLTSALNPPDYRPHPLHVFLVVSDLLGRISPLALTPAWLALAGITCWPWGALRPAAAVVSLSSTLVDGVGLALLPRLERSFGPVTPPLLALTVLRAGITFSAGLLWGSQLALIAVVGLQLVLIGTALYATWIEPFRIQVTRQNLQSFKLDGTSPLRLLHISDLHVERITTRERQLLDLVDDLAPDLVVLTGDYLNISSVGDSRAQEDATELLDGHCNRSPGPIYAITGSPPVDREGLVPDLFEGTDVIWLTDDMTEVEINGHTLRLAGLRCTRQRAQDVPRLRHLLASADADPFTLLLYHSPDLMPEAVELGVDLYLCGHTHGGQLRVPLFGALITSSAFWKRYEMGRYDEAGTTLYVSRGLGMEGFGAPRARFLSPPEIILWTLSSD